ncbi:Galactose oxidase [Leucoagaricus sp. SymC.cos]|nr:Galactose oxidase [Leucoagaricus sp. SymC.cos]
MHIFSFSLTSKLVVYLSLFIASFVLAEEAPKPGQPQRKGQNGKFQVIGESLVNAQQMFLGTADKVYIIDKVENNAAQINGHPAWAQEYALGSNSQRPMDIVTNSFCAGGGVLGNGSWINVGGNQAVTYGGLQAASQVGGPPYNDPDGRRSMVTPCDDGKCDWLLLRTHIDERWYPTVYVLPSIGGCRWGGYVNDPAQNNPSYEFFPKRGEPILSPFLASTLPTNLYPLTFLLPSGRLFVQANWAAILLDYTVGKEVPLDPMPDAVRTYPASAGTVVLPMTPANNWTATILFCGGSNVTTPQWSDPGFVAIQQKASTSCVKITPDVSPNYQHDDPLPDGRSMANFILLPDGTVFCVNGARFGKLVILGTAGYGNNSWAVGQSYADEPQLMSLIYNGSAPEGRRWSSEGLSPSQIPRMYHSSATLLPDGSVLVAGSNPNSDYATDVKYPTQYKVETFYPPYYNTRRPEPQGLLTQLSYGGSSFTVTLTLDDLHGDITNIARTKVVVIRTGFSTHSMNMGQRYVELESTYGASPNKSGFLRVSQMPPNPAIMAPGPAFLFVIVDGVPSIGIQVMVGSGQLGNQKILPVEPLPEASMPKGSKDFKTSSAGRSLKELLNTLAVIFLGTLGMALVLVFGGVI